MIARADISELIQVEPSAVEVPDAAIEAVASLLLSVVETEENTKHVSHLEKDG